ncbi:flavin reductase family protein [Orrella daihaiensis]|uniref:Flavin reductase family protein n=1 Tax=Orrella daihaiensis TaxID=2782176 RepID=A0ABY4AJG3_9BURK|nr:flavin reductase family protein [Orrella daihaiensis]UOD49796.1 flavin reductase family protein [Orrella daihaiensis]
MFYEPSHGHGLPFNPFKAIIAPRPIGWVSTIDGQGRPNLAPYSFFNAVSGVPEMIMFSSEGLKDSVRNARETGEFVYNLVSASLMQAMNATSAALDPGENEFEFAKLGSAPSRIVKPPRVADTPAALECKVTAVNELVDMHGELTGRYMVIGQVVGVHIADDCLVNGRFDMLKAQTMARCGYQDYAQVTTLTQLLRPGEAPLKA